MKTISLFSGAGGLDLGAVAAGAEIVFANDVLAEAAEAHGQLIPNANFFLGDIRGISQFPDADLVMGGYPCQPFSLGGARRPDADERSVLFREFARCVESVKPSFFVAENVAGLRGLGGRRWLNEQLTAFSELGYKISWQILKADEHGVPQRRRRLFIVGVRSDRCERFDFDALPRTRSVPHGDVIAHLPSWPEGEFYERADDPDSNWSWYYMSRNRKAPWDGPSYTVLANYRHTPVHPASPAMELEWSNLADGWKQRWRFSNRFEHVEGDAQRLTLPTPRRLAWREGSLLQTFPEWFSPPGSLRRKFELIGNAVPPRLGETLVRGITTQSALAPT